MALEMNTSKIPKRILSSLIASVSAGVVPRLGAPYIAIGRNDEIDALLSDLRGISEGGASMRFIIGKYGSGKSFLMQLVRGYAIERGFVCADADLSPERRICGGKGCGIATYRELMRNMSSKASPSGGAMNQIVAKWLSDIKMRTVERGFSPDSESFSSEFERTVFETVRRMEDFIGGFDFASILAAYYRADTLGDDVKKAACLRWLRGEYSNKTEARDQTGLKLSGIIDDENWYDYIKLWAAFVREIGFGGFVVFIDECVNLYKISNRLSRENNYEKILSMFNDTLQGKAQGLALILGGTPQFLEDTRRGLYSYEALKSRLCPGRFSDMGYKDMLDPVIRLRRLSDNELFALIVRVNALFEEYYGVKLGVSEDNMTRFLSACLTRAGADSMITPREMIRDYITVLNILMQNPGVSFDEIMQKNGDKAKDAKLDEHTDGVHDQTRTYTAEDIEF